MNKIILYKIGFLDILNFKALSKKRLERRPVKINFVEFVRGIMEKYLIWSIKLSFSSPVSLKGPNILLDTALKCEARLARHGNFSFLNSLEYRQQIQQSSK